MIFSLCRSRAESTISDAIMHVYNTFYIQRLQFHLSQIFNVMRTKHARSIYWRIFFQNAKFRQNKLNNYMLRTNYLTAKKSPRIWRASKIEAFTIHVCNIRKENECVSLKYNQQDVTFSRSIFLYKLLYMIQAVSPPIIRSTELYIQRQVLSNQYCLNNNSALSLNYNQQDATFSRSIYFYKLLYMFQAVPPPIIRSTKLYIQRQVLSNCLLL